MLVLIYQPWKDGKLSWLRQKKRLHKYLNLGRARIKLGTLWSKGRDLTNCANHAHPATRASSENCCKAEPTSHAYGSLARYAKHTSGNACKEKIHWEDLGSLKLQMWDSWKNRPPEQLSTIAHYLNCSYMGEAICVRMQQTMQLCTGGFFLKSFFLLVEKYKGGRGQTRETEVASSNFIS